MLLKLKTAAWGEDLQKLPPLVRWAVYILFVAALLFLLGQFLVYVHFAASLFRFPFDYDQGEGFELYDTVLHSQGKWPYQDSQVFPFYTSIYPPLFHLMVAPLVWLFGPQLWTGRVVGFVGTLITASAIAWAVRRDSEKSGWLVPALFGLTFLASNYTFTNGPLFRQHMTMVMFETLAMVVLGNFRFANHNHLKVASDTKATKNHEISFVNFMHFESSWLTPHLVFGATLLLAAGYTKQLALATVLAALLYLFIREPRRTVVLGIIMAAVAGGIFLFINWQTEGWWYVSIIQANINAFSFQQMGEFYYEWFELHLILGVGALAALVWELVTRRLNASVYAVWFVFALGNGALSGKYGAGESYFVTLTVAACILAGRAAVKLQQNVSVSKWVQITFAIALPVLFIYQTRLTLQIYTEGPIYGPIARFLNVTDNSGRGYYDSQGYTQLGPRPKLADYEAGYKIAALARNVEGPVFSEEAGLMFVAGKPVVTNPFVQLMMFRAGLFNPQNEIDMLRRKEFGMVILRAHFYPPAVLAAIQENYQGLESFQMNGFTYFVLIPRP
jgi:4-amino-4-deoxy-L-arabinose transferase-like glycosyltransferase